MTWIERLRPHPSANAISRLEHREIINTGPQKFSGGDKTTDAGPHDGNPRGSDAWWEEPDAAFDLAQPQEGTVVVQQVNAGR